MSKNEQLAKLKQDYLHHAHRLQAGVAMKIGRDNSDATPKHLRVGIDSAHVSDLAIARLLIKKGIISEIEYYQALAQAMKDEADKLEKELSEKMGADITLGSLY